MSGDAIQETAAVHVGYCAILGLPNVGKSTLLNRLLGVRLAAVSARPQTTRNRILGVHNLELAAETEADEATPAQIIFFDTPGLQQGASALRRYMREQSLAAAGECDVVLLVVDVSDRAQREPGARRTGADSAVLEVLEAAGAPAVLALNKIDKLQSKAELLPIIEAYSEGDRYAAIVPISARTGEGLPELAVEVARRLPLGPRLFPEEMYTDRAEKFLAGELVREQLFRQLGEEVPYATAVVVESFEDRQAKGDVVISAVVHVERESQKGIVVGKGGSRIKSVGQNARKAISQLLGCPVHLRLFVKVSPNWSRDKAGLRDMGYE